MLYCSFQRFQSLHVQEAFPRFQIPRTIAVSVLPNWISKMIQATQYTYQLKLLAVRAPYLVWLAVRHMSGDLTLEGEIRWNCGPLRLSDEPRMDTLAVHCISCDQPCVIICLKIRVWRDFGRRVIDVQKSGIESKSSSFLVVVEFSLGMLARQRKMSIAQVGRAIEGMT